MSDEQNPHRKSCTAGVTNLLCGWCNPDVHLAAMQAAFAAQDEWQKQASAPDPEDQPEDYEAATIASAVLDAIDQVLAARAGGS